MRQIIALLFAIFFLFHITYCQNKYYFSNNVSNKGNGTKEQPFQSLKNITEIIFRPGDTVFFCGDSINGNIVLQNLHGNKQQSVVFTSFGNVTCTINGKDKEAFVISSSDYFAITNLTFGSGRKTGNTANGLKLEKCTNTTLKNLNVSGFQKSGILLFNCKASEIDSVYLHDNGFAGIQVEGDYQKRISNDIHIVNCRADNNPGDPTVLDNHSGNGIIIGNSRNVLVEYCSATNNGWDMPRVGNGPVGIWAYEADSVIIQNCISYRNKTAKNAADGGGFDLDGGVTNSVIQYCLSYENWGSGYGIFQYNSAGKWFNNTVRYCVSINDGNVTDKASAMLIWNGSNEDSAFTHFVAYHNFFYNDTKYAFGFLEESQHRQFYFLNNIFIAGDASNIFNGIDSSINDVFLGNIWMKKNGGFLQNGFTDLKKWSRASGYEWYNKRLTGITFRQKLFLIPNQVDNITDPHKLHENILLLSLCRNNLNAKGIDIKKVFAIDTGNRDFFGNSIPQGRGYEPGICEMK
jgi:hypothetical protein